MPATTVWTLRLSGALWDQLRSIASRIHGSESDVLRSWLRGEDLPGGEGPDYSTAQGAIEAWQDIAAPEGLLIWPCSRCGEDIVFDLLCDEDFSTELRLAFAGWVHEDCLAGRGATDDEAVFRSVVDEEGACTLALDLLPRSVPVSVRLSAADQKALRRHRPSGKAALRSDLKRYLDKEEDFLDTLGEEAYQSAWERETVQGKGRMFPSPCFAYHEPMLIDPGESVRAAEIIGEITRNWTHAECLKGNARWSLVRRTPGGIEVAATDESFVGLDPRFWARRIRPLLQDYPIH